MTKCRHNIYFYLFYTYTLVLRMNKYSTLKIRMEKCKERVKEKTKIAQDHIIKLKKRKSSNLTPFQFEMMERQEAEKLEEERMKGTIINMINTLGEHSLEILIYP